MRIAYPKNDEELAARVKEINETKIPTFISYWEKLLNSRGGKHFAGNKVSYHIWEDILKSCKL